MPPILSHKHYDAASTFKPENLLREARRQKGLPEAPVPEICILDPDGDMVRYLCNLDQPSAIPDGLATTPTSMSFVKAGMSMASSAALSEPRLRSLSPRSCSLRAAGFL